MAVSRRATEWYTPFRLVRNRATSFSPRPVSNGFSCWPKVGSSFLCGFLSFNCFSRCSGDFLLFLVVSGCSGGSCLCLAVFGCFGLFLFVSCCFPGRPPVVPPGRPPVVPGREKKPKNTRTFKKPTADLGANFLIFWVANLAPKFLKSAFSYSSPSVYSEACGLELPLKTRRGFLQPSPAPESAFLSAASLHSGVTVLALPRSP